MLPRVIDPPEPSRPAAREDEEAPGEGRDGEVVDALPVLAGRRRALLIERLSRALARDRAADGMAPAVQTAAVAAGGFVAGAALLSIVHRRQRRAPALARVGDRGRIGRRRARRNRGGVERLEIVGSRSLLVDVHLLGLPGSER
jgi:hypothetical protein